MADELNIGDGLTCDLVQIIDASECIGNSLEKINNNFKDVDNGLCNLTDGLSETLRKIEYQLTLINQLSSEMRKPIKVAEFEENIPPNTLPTVPPYDSATFHVNDSVNWDRPLNEEKFNNTEGRVTLNSPYSILLKPGAYKIIMGSYLQSLFSTYSVMRVTPCLRRTGGTGGPSIINFSNMNAGGSDGNPYRFDSITHVEITSDVNYKVQVQKQGNFYNGASGSFVWITNYTPYDSTKATRDIPVVITRLIIECI